jgi:hypothetical protein
MLHRPSHHSPTILTKLGYQQHLNRAPITLPEQASGHHSGIVEYEKIARVKVARKLSEELDGDRFGGTINDKELCLIGRIPWTLCYSF